MRKSSLVHYLGNGYDAQIITYIANHRLCIIFEMVVQKPVIYTLSGKMLCCVNHHISNILEMVIMRKSSLAHCLEMDMLCIT